MRHATAADLVAIEDLLAAVRGHPELTERKRGVFYRKSVAFLHFHADPAGLFADLKVGGCWKRLRVETRAERRRLISAVAAEFSTRFG